MTAMVQSDTRLSPSRDRANVLGVGVDAIDLPTAVQRLSRAIEERSVGYVCVTGVHGVMEARRDPGFRRTLNRSLLTTPDGMPLVWAGRMQGKRAMDRVYGPDLMLALCEASLTRGYRHFLYGGAPGVAEELQRSLIARFPGLKIVGTFTPPFRPLAPEEESALGSRLHETRPDVMWIGLSTPKQELFMARYSGHLSTTLMIGVGAAFDMHAGRVRQAPRWVQRSGFEWLFRLSQEPRRLAKRYIVNNPSFIYHIALQAAGLARYRVE